MLSSIDNARHYLSALDIDVFCYHHPCDDGFAAFTIAKTFFVKHGKHVKYVGMSRRSQLVGVQGKNILFADFAPEPSFLDNLNAKKVLILDHHISAFEKYKDHPGAHFDNTKCGAMLVWNYFYPTKPVPYFIDLIQDKDLHLCLNPESDPFTSMLRLEPYKFTIFSKFFDIDYCKQMIKQGYVLASFNSCMADFESKKARHKFLKTPLDNKYPVLVLNCSAHWLFEKITEKLSGSIVLFWFYNHEDNSISVCLRSTFNNINLSEIANQFSGGGHKNSAGFKYHGNISDMIYDT